MTIYVIGVRDFELAGLDFTAVVYVRYMARYLTD
jgi:hypothetical protein